MFTRKVKETARICQSRAIRCVLLATALCCVFSIPVTASTVIVTNKAKVPVSDQSVSSRREALKQALEQVLIKMSGSAQTITHPAVKQALKSPARYLSAYQFSYEDGQQFYEGEFSRQVLVELLRDASLPVWGQRRPDTLLWLATEEGDDKWILREGQRGELAAQINKDTRQRGIPITLPLMDLTDNSNISVYDVWGHFSRVLNQASERYRPDFIIGARLHEKAEASTPTFLSTEEQLEQALSQSNLAFSYSNDVDTTPAPSASATVSSDARELLPDGQTMGSATALSESDNTSQNAAKPASAPVLPARVGEGDFALEWVLLEGSDSQFGTVRAASAKAAIAAFIEIYGEYLGQRFAISFDAQDETQGTTVSISVANLDGLNKYVHAQRFLTEMSVVKHAMLSKQSGSVAVFEIKLAGTVSDFINALSMDSQLQPVRDAFGRPLEGHNFYWNE
ncbi:DUF2066 domain-containing protein [Salinimonas chungwhensis]|uniref:DUF2066 domain-containing protein n=1 Tax=Salinimonas chungwhensis TaxID=265425 RepID=UPI0003634F30|nr:DUF2066 domain-containing protein [Salinimonas chungwhensis]